MSYERPDDLDLSVRLEPVSTPFVLEPKKSGLNRAAVFLIVVFGGLLAIGALAAVVGIVLRVSDVGHRNAVVTAQRDSDLLREESAAVFGKYDASESGHVFASEAERKDREAIDELFKRIEQCASKSADEEEFCELVDFDRMMKRIELTGNLVRYSALEKRQWRHQLQSATTVMPFWSELTVAGVVTPNDDPDSRVVYVYSKAKDSPELIENRLWIGRAGDGWKLYDWSRLDLGFAESQEWGMRAQYEGGTAMDGYHRWGQLVAEADKLIQAGDEDAAKQKLRLAEKETVPDGFHDYHLVLTGYRWNSLGETDAAESCFKKVLRPEDTPGAFYGLLTCNRWRRPAEALQYAAEYESAVGPGVDLIEIKADLLKRLGREEEAFAEWQKLLRYKPNDPHAFAEYVLSAPTENAGTLESVLDRLPDPVSAVVSAASAVGDENYERLVLCEKYVNRKAPDSIGALYVSGLVKKLDGQYQEAARFFHEAYKKETDKDKQQSYFDDYLSAMSAAGKAAEALQQAPETKSAFDAMFYAYDEGDSNLTEDDYRQVVALIRKLDPNDLNGIHRDADLAISDQRFADAERLAREGLEKLKAAGGGIETGESKNDDSDDESEADEVDSYRESLQQSLVAALFYLDRWKEAYEGAEDRRGAFVQLTRLAGANDQWDMMRELAALHRAVDAEDPQISKAEARLAARENHWDDAVRLLRQAMKSDESENAWQYDGNLIDLYMDSGKSIEFMKSSDDPAKTFENLSRQFAANEDWEELEKLVGAYRGISPVGRAIDEAEADLAWHNEEYSKYATIAQMLLNRKDDSVADFERIRLQNRLVSALVRSRKFAQVRQLALSVQHDRNGIATLAAVSAATGDLGGAERLALESARRNESALALYSHPDAGRVFLSQPFRKLHSAYPINLPYEAAHTDAIFIFNREQTLTAQEVNAAASEAGIVFAGFAQPVESSRNGSAFRITLDRATVWVMAGSGHYNEGWRAVNEKHAMAGALDRGRGWLVVGSSSYIEEDRSKAEQLARKLAAALVGERADVACMRNPRTYLMTMYPANAELMSAWVKSGRAKGFAREGCAIVDESQNYDNDDREFQQALANASREFEASEGSQFEVIAFSNSSPRIDPLRMRVKKVRRSHGYLTFDGELVKDSMLVSELLAGTPMQMTSLQIQEFRLNDGGAVVRKE